MTKPVFINEKIKNFEKKITISGDKSLSIRWALMASQATGNSKAYNLLHSEDVLSTLKCLKKLGTKINLKKNYCKIMGLGLNSFDFKKNLTLDARNSGTLGRLILGLLIHCPHKVKLIGDKSLSKRDFSRVINPLKNFGANFYQSKKKGLPLYIQGTKYVRPIKYFENR